jgi:hypothetical protein
MISARRQGQIGKDPRCHSFTSRTAPESRKPTGKAICDSLYRAMRETLNVPEDD